ncbi:MAG: hypothetical protein Q7T30_03210 [Planctomycetota bacterium]|nr:hypothetical protein [Planctomycetota bacterium]
MTRSAPAPSQHLLTRADLARLEIPAGSILAWLADGWLDQVGSLPGIDGRCDPVFAVLSRDLRLDLAARLASIGKDAIVFSSARVRSVLLRAMMSSAPAPAANANLPTTDPVGPAASEPMVASAEPDQALPATATDEVPDAVPEALELTVELLAHEVDAFVEMTRQEARLDAIELATADPEPADRAEAADDVGDDVDCFDAEDLFGELDSWGPPDAPTTRRSDSPAEWPQPDVVVAEPPALEIEMELPTRTDPEPGSPPPAAVEDTMQEATNEPQTLVPTDAAIDLASRATTTIAEPTANDALPPRGETDAPTAMQAMARVESFLGELRLVLVELANRPQFQVVDMQPLVTAVQSGFGDSAASASATHSAITSLTERLGDFGKRVEVGVALAVRTALEHEAASHPASARPAAFVVARTDRTSLLLFGIGFLLLCWTAIFWFKTGSPRLALGTLVGANLIGCCLLTGRKRAA